MIECCFGDAQIILAAHREDDSAARQLCCVALEGEEGDAIKAATDTLSQSSMKLGEAIYKASQEEAEGAAGAGMDDAPPADDNVVDADFEEVDDDDAKDKTA